MNNKIQKYQLGKVLSNGLKWLLSKADDVTSINNKLAKKGLGKLYDFSEWKMPIKSGGEATVYIDSDKVYKIFNISTPEKTLSQIAKFNQNILKRNVPPYTAPLTFEGVVRGSKRGMFYPVYSQQRLNVIDIDTPYQEWMKYKSNLTRSMIKSGWSIDGSGYYNPTLKMHLADITPGNIARDNAGNIFIIDGFVYKFGGKINENRKISVRKSFK